MAFRKLLRDFFLSKQPLSPHLSAAHQVPRTANLPLITSGALLGLVCANHVFNKDKAEEDNGNQNLEQDRDWIIEIEKEPNRIIGELEMLSKNLKKAMAELEMLSKNLKKAMAELEALEKKEEKGSLGPARASSHHGANK